MFDEDLRAQLRDAARRAEPERDVGADAARARALAQAMAHEMARARLLRRAGIALGFAMAAGVALAIGLRPDRAPTAPIAEVPPPPPGCAARPTRPDATRALDGAGRHDFGARFRVQTSETTRVHVDAASPCEAVLTLAQGHVDVFARALEGGTLRVRAGRVEAEVHGTRFRVALAEDAVDVHVSEGHVRVRDRGRVVAELHAGESVHVDANGAATGTLTDDVRRALESLVAETPPETAVAPTTAPEVPAPPRATTTDAGAAPPSDALVLEAERAQREGRLDDARALFRRAGASSTAIGEAAWIRLARLELRAGRPAEARAAIREHDRRFRSGRLAAEALFVDAQAARAVGQLDAANAAERVLLERFPDSPQAARVRARLLE